MNIVDLVVSWMSHLGTGSWRAFCRAVDELALPSTSSDVQRRQLRTALSDLGIADFFVDGTQSWRTLAPTIGGFESRPNCAALWGGRTPQLVDAISLAADSCGCRVSQLPRDSEPTCVRIEGDEAELERMARICDLLYVPDMAQFCLASAATMASRLQRAPCDPAPINWSVRSFDLTTLQWVDGLRPRSACEYMPRYGAPKFYLHTRRGTFFRLAKRDAVYAAASLRRVDLISYDFDSCRLSVPLAAPLPDSLARAACLCSGTMAEVVDGRFCYSEVPGTVARGVMIAAGQGGHTTRPAQLVRYFDG